MLSAVVQMLQKNPLLASLGNAQLDRGGDFSSPHPGFD
jgi:hypothetical protein